MSVMVTLSMSSTQWTCFNTSSVWSCCDAIHRTNRALGILWSEPLECESQVAKVPEIDELPHLADFSLILAAQDSICPDDMPICQFLWQDDIVKPVENGSLETLSSPFILEGSMPSSIHMRSELSSSGGMHRSLTHHVQSSTNVQARYIFHTIPRSVFIDLDDSVADYNGKVKIHSSSPCDIEQPAFVSKQHVIVFELSGVSKDEFELKLTTKLHFRYPDPSPARGQWVAVPVPHLLCRTRNATLLSESTLNPESFFLHIWVAAGCDGDHNLVMIATIVACLLGVIWMLSDISHVSRWDVV